MGVLGARRCRRSAGVATAARCTQGVTGRRDADDAGVGVAWGILRHRCGPQGWRLGFREISGSTRVARRKSPPTVMVGGLSRWPCDGVGRQASAYCDWSQRRRYVGAVTGLGALKGGCRPSELATQINPRWRRRLDMHILLALLTQDDLPEAIGYCAAYVLRCRGHLRLAALIDRHAPTASTILRLAFTVHILLP